MQPNSDRIVAYLVGDLSPDEITAFECEMETNPALRVEVESLRGVMGEVRAWMLSDAPGSERVETISPGLETLGYNLRSPLKRTEYTRYLLQALAACLIFYLGYALGTATTAPPLFEERVPPPQLVAQVPLATPAPSVVTAAIVVPTSEPPKPEPVQKPVRTQAVDEGGRVVIQTTLTGSTSRAVWVVDGNFRIEQPGI